MPRCGSQCILCDVPEFVVEGQTYETYPLATDDPNYGGNLHYAKPYLIDNIVQTDAVSQTPTQWGRKNETEYFDVSKVTMELLCIISFNNFKSLATLNTADTKKFLDQVLGFYTLTEYADICKQFRQENDVTVNSISRQITNVSAQIDKLNEMADVELTVACDVQNPLSFPQIR